MSEPSFHEREWPATGGMAAAGVAGGVLIAWATGDRMFNSDVGYGAIVLQSTLVAVVIAVGTWLTRRRPWRAFAIGLVGCWLVVLLLISLVWTSNDPAPSPGGSPSPVGRGHPTA